LTNNLYFNTVDPKQQPKKEDLTKVTLIRPPPAVQAEEKVEKAEKVEEKEQ